MSKFKCNYCGAIHDGDHSCPEVERAFLFMTVNQCPNCGSASLAYEATKERHVCRNCKSDWPAQWKKEVKK